MTSGEHTKGRWETDKIAVRSSGPNGRQICLCEIVVRGRPYDETYDEAIANANLIVTAVNTYPAVAELVKALEMARGYVADDVRRKPSEYDPSFDLATIDSALTRFREAQAGGGA